MRYEGVDWIIHLAHDVGQWRFVAKTVMKFQVPFKMQGISWPDKKYFVLKNGFDSWS